MTDYIKRIQSRLSHKDIKKSRSVLLEEVSLLGYNHENLTSDLADLITAKLLDKFNFTEVQIESIVKSDNLLEPIPQPLRCENFLEDSSIEEVLQLPIVLEESTSIAVSDQQKHELVTTQSSALDVELSSAETFELCSKIPDVFDDYESFVVSVTGSLKAFIDDKFDKQEKQSVNDSISDLRQHIATRQARLDSKLAAGLNEVKGDLEQIRSNLKSRQAAILERLKANSA